jgi:hypothetical protein
VNDELERMWKKVVVAEFKTLTGGTEENPVLEMGRYLPVYDTGTSFCS